MKMRIKFIILLFSMTIMAYAQENSIRDIFEQELRVKNENITSIKCQFVQTRGMSVLASTVSKEGVFHFERPSSMQLLFLDGDYIKMDEQQFEMKVAENVTETKIDANPMLKNLRSILGACVIGDFSQMTKGFLAELEHTQTEWIVTMKPQRGKSASKISQIVISFDQNDMSLNCLNLVEKSGDYTMYQFTDKVFNVNK